MKNLKFFRRILAAGLVFLMVFPMLPTISLSALGESQPTRGTSTDATAAIKADPVISAALQGSTQHFADDGYIGIPYEITVYYDKATHGNAKSGYSTLGATPVVLYVVNADFERIGTDSDVSIIRSMLQRGYAVAVCDYLNNAKAKSPDLDWSSQLIRKKLANGDFFADKTTFPSGTYQDNVTVPAGYDIAINKVFFELDKHGTDGTLQKIVNVWNNDFRMYKKDVIVKWVHADGTRKTVQNGFDGSSPVWYSDAAGKTVNATSGIYTKIGYTKAVEITDCVKADGTPIDLNLYLNIVYPTNPEKDVPVMMLMSSAGYAMTVGTTVDRPQFSGFLFAGYAGVMVDYAWIPMGRGDHYGTFDGSSGEGKSVTGDNMTYATHTFNSTQAVTAAVRYIRYLSLTDHDTYAFNNEKFGHYGISKSAWDTHLGSPILSKNLLTVADGLTDAQIAQRVNDKINTFYQMEQLKGYDGRTRYDKGITSTYTKDGFTVDGGELQPWTVYNGNEIASGVQALYSCCGGAIDWFCEGYAPQFISENLSDTSYTEYGQQNLMVNLCRNLNMPALWYEIDIAHIFAYGPDYNYGVDTYDAFFRFMNYYLKDTPVSVTYTNPVDGSVILATDSLTVKFIGEVSATEIEKVTVTDPAGNAVTGTWQGAFGGTEWTFLPENLSGGTEYTLTVPANLRGSNGEEMGYTFTASFSTRAEGTTTLSETPVTVSKTGTTVSLTVPQLASATGYKLRLLVKNDSHNQIYAYDAADNSYIGRVRVSGAGYYEIDVASWLSKQTEGDTVTVKLVTQSADGNVVTYSQTFDENTGNFGASSNATVTSGVPINGELALKVVPKTNAGKYQGDHEFYPNMENAYVASTNKFMKNGSGVTAEDVGRTFLITFRVYDTLSRPFRVWMNSATSRPDTLLDFDRFVYTTSSVAGEWVEYTFPYTVYEAKYGLASQTKTLYLQVHPSGSTEVPFYIDSFRVEEVFTDVAVSSVDLVAETDGLHAIQAPTSANAFSVGGVEYATWKSAITAAGYGSVVTMLRDYTMTDTDSINLAAKNGIVIDLGGYKLTVRNTKNAPLWFSATSTTTCAVTLKNGAVELGDTPLISYGSSTTAGNGKTINVRVEGIHLTVRDLAQTRTLLSESSTTAGVKLRCNITLADSLLDVDRFHLPDRKLTLFSSGGDGLTIRYTAEGGVLRMNSFHEITLCTSLITAAENERGELFAIEAPASADLPSPSFKMDGVYYIPTANGTVGGYVRYDLIEAEDSTPYGVVPNGYEDTERYPLALFSEDAFLGCTANWKDALTLARTTLASNPGKTVEIVLRRDYAVGEYCGNSNWLCYMNGGIVFDLGGYTITTSMSLFEAGVDASYTGSYDTSFTVRNGEAKIGAGNLFAAQQNSSTNKNMTVTFENVVFSIDPDTYLQTRNKFFYAQKDRSGITGCLNLALTLDGCILDTRNIPGSFTAFSFSGSTVTVKADILVKGGGIIADSFDNITWYTYDVCNDTFLFAKGDDGKYPTLTVTNGLTPSLSVLTAEGIFAYTNLVTDGDESDVYEPIKDSLTTPYGEMPLSEQNKTFALFSAGQFVGSAQTWKDALTLARTTLASNPGKRVEIYMNKDRSVTSYTGSSNWLAYMNGTILLDMNGHTMIAATTSIFEAGAEAAYSGSYDTTLLVKNGTVLIGGGNLFGAQHHAAVNKKITATFENVTFGVDSATYNAEKRNRLFYGDNDKSCAGKMTLNLTLNGCTIDLRNVPHATTSFNFTVFAFGTTTNSMAADVRVIGGNIVTNSFANITFHTVSSDDSFLFVKDGAGNYPTLTVTNGLTPSLAVPTPEGDVAYTVLAEDGAEFDVYTVAFTSIVTPYGTIPEAGLDQTFALFMGGNYLGSAQTWKDALTLARTTLASNAGGTVEIYMNKDRSVTAYTGSYNWLAYMNGTILLDMNGHTMIAATTSIFEVGAEAAYAGNYDTTLLVKNGTVLIGGGNLFGAQHHSSVNKKFTATFENVTFGVDPATYNAEKRYRLFYGENDLSCPCKMTLDLTLDGCTIDLRNVPHDSETFNFTVFAFGITTKSITADIRVRGGNIIANSFANITFYTMASDDTFLFVKDGAGNYPTLTVTNGLTPALTVPTSEGTFSFSALQTDGAEFDVYVLGVTTDYGVMPLSEREKTFALFSEGNFLGGTQSWRDALTLARTTLNAHPGKQVEIFMNQDRAVTSYVGTANWLAYMNGSILLDMNGHTMISSVNSLFEAGADAGYTGEFDTTLTVRNGTVLVGANNLFATQHHANVDKKITVTFEGVTFGIDPETYAERRNRLIYGDNDANCTGKMTLDLTLDGCTIDLRNVPHTTSSFYFTVFAFGTTTESVTADIRVIGGNIVTNSFENVTFYTMASDDSFLFVKDGAGNYPTLTVTNGLTPDLIVPTAEGDAAYTVLSDDGAEFDVYLLDRNTPPKEPLGSADFSDCTAGSTANVSTTLAGTVSGYSILAETVGDRQNLFYRMPLATTNVRTTLRTSAAQTRGWNELTVGIDLRYSAKSGADTEGQFNIQLVDRTSGTAKFWQILRIKTYNGAVIIDNTVDGNVFTSAVLNPGEWGRFRILVNTATGDVTLYFNGEFITTVATNNKNFLVDQSSVFVSVNAASSSITADIDNFSLRYTAKTCDVTVNGVPTQVQMGDTVSLAHTGKKVAYFRMISDGVETFERAESVTVFADAEITVVYLDMETLTGASVRIANPSGIRYATALSKEDFDALLSDPNVRSIAIGTLISPTSYVGIASFDFTKDALNATRLVTENLATPYLDVAATVGSWFREDEERYYFAGSVVNIRDYGMEFSGVGYLELTMADGTVLTVSGGYDRTKHSRSVACVANRALKDLSQDWNRAESNLLLSLSEGYVDYDALYGGEGKALHGLRVLAIGDSLFAGHKTGANFVWMQMLADRYGWNFTNYGLNGGSVSDYNGGKWPMITRYTQMTTEDADEVDLIFVEGGYNDFQISVPVGNSSEAISTTFMGAMHQMIDALLARYPNAKIAIVTPWDLTSGTMTDPLTGITYNYGQYTDFLRVLYADVYADHDRVILIDAGDAEVSGIRMDDADFRQMWSYLPNDRFHLNAGGMYLMANAMRHELYRELTE